MEKAREVGQALLRLISGACAGVGARARMALPRTALASQLSLLLPSVLVLVSVFLYPHGVLLLRGGTQALAQNSTLSSGFSAALSLRFPSTLATDDTLTAGAEELEALLDAPSLQGNGSQPSSLTSSGAGEGESVVRAPVVDVDMKGLSVVAAAERRARQEQLTGQDTSCSCYKVKNAFCCSQTLCLCGPLCWNGKELVAQVKHGSAAVDCREPLEADKAGDIVVDGNVLSPIKCGDAVEPEFGLKAQPLSIALEEGGFRELGMRDLGWLQERQKTTTWRMDGATFLRKLDVRAASDASAFASRLFPLLLLNNATVHGSLHRPPVRHLLLPRDRFFRGVAEEHGPEGLLAHLLELLLRSALEPLRLGSGGFVVPEWHRQRVVRDEVDPTQEKLLGGTTGGSGSAIQRHVEYDHAWDSATESAPLCMEQAILPGTLKGLVYPNNTQQAEAFQAQALQFLGLQAPASEMGRVRVLFARRTDVSDRVFEAESEQRLLALLREVGFAQVQVLDLSPVSSGAPLTLPQVVQAVQGADVIVGLHSSALVHAGLFLRPGTVLVEVVPHHLFFSDVQVLVAASGGLFLQHMLLPSEAPPTGPSASRTSAALSTAEGGVDTINFEFWDKEYSGHTVAHCMNQRLNFRCRQYFMRDRPILLSPMDAAELSGLLGLAKHFVETSHSHGLGEARAELARQSVSVCKSGFMDLGFVATDWLFDPSLPNQKCILKRTYWRET